MRQAILIAIALLSASTFAADPIHEAIDEHINLISDAAKKRDTLAAQEHFEQFSSLFCNTMKNPQEVERCKSGMSKSVGTLIHQMTEMLDSPPDDKEAREQPWQTAGVLAQNGESKEGEVVIAGQNINGNNVVVKFPNAFGGLPKDVAEQVAGYWISSCIKNTYVKSGEASIRNTNAASGMKIIFITGQWELAEGTSKIILNEKTGSLQCESR